MASSAELSAFLENVERRAYKQALYAAREHGHALDIVQDSMFRLSRHYGDRPAGELPLLFQRVLRNAIMDFFRRQKVRTNWITLFSSLTAGDDQDVSPGPEILGAESAHPDFADPAEQFERQRTLAVIDEALQQLPARQREAFIMRYWEDMSVSETASAMGCSEGSVKTHCSRAAHALAEILKLKGIHL